MSMSNNFNRVAVLLLALLAACSKANDTAPQPTFAPTTAAIRATGAPAPPSAAASDSTAAPPPNDVAPPTDAVALVPQPDAVALLLPPGFRADVYAQGFNQPTALAFGPDQRLYITQLNGGENDNTGQVLVVDKPGATPRVVLDGLFKPTGLVWRGTDVYVAAGRDVLQTRADDAGQLAPPDAVVHDLPFNTRSEGQIDLLPDGRLLFEASGLVNDPQSGRLFTLEPGGQPQVLATGLKNAYAHTVDPTTGQIYTTDIGDDPVDGKPPPEEINVVQAGGDYGWPRCYAERIPADDRGATAETCAKTQPSIVTFPPRSTPSGLAFYAGSDFPAAYRGALYVALWNGNPPQVQRVTLQQQNGTTVGDATQFIGGLKQPIDLLPDPRGGLLVLDYGAGVIYRVTATDN